MTTPQESKERSVWVVIAYDGKDIAGIYTDSKLAYYLFGDSDEWYIEEQPLTEATYDGSTRA